MHGEPDEDYGPIPVTLGDVLVPAQQIETLTARIAQLETELAAVRGRVMEFNEVTCNYHRAGQFVGPIEKKGDEKKWADDAEAEIAELRPRTLEEADKKPPTR